MFTDKIGNLPIGGFFCSGEIGPVGGTTFLHGYTSVFGIVRQRSAVMAKMTNYEPMPSETYTPPTKPTNPQTESPLESLPNDSGDEDYD